MKLALLGLLISLLLSAASFAEDSVTEASPQSSPLPGRSQVQKKGAQIRFSNKSRGSSGNSKRDRAMPPAGSAATGGSSASPGGLQTTPYGNP